MCGRSRHQLLVLAATIRRGGVGGWEADHARQPLVSDSGCDTAEFLWCFGGRPVRRGDAALRRAYHQWGIQPDNGRKGTRELVPFGIRATQARLHTGARIGAAWSDRFAFAARNDSAPVRRGRREALPGLCIPGVACREWIFADAQGYVGPALADAGIVGTGAADCVRESGKPDARAGEFAGTRSCRAA